MQEKEKYIAIYDGSLHISVNNTFDLLHIISLLPSAFASAGLQLRDGNRDEPE